MVKSHKSWRLSLKSSCFFAVLFVGISLLGVGVAWNSHLKKEFAIKDFKTASYSAQPNERIVVFSDSHLSCDFDREKSDFIEKIVQDADVVIINGDFWDYYECDFSDFLKSGYEDLFRILKEKQTYYLYGNHDLQRYSDTRVSEFSDVQANQLVLGVKDKKYVFEHGNRLFPSSEEEYPLLFRNRPAVRLGGRAEGLGVRIFGKRFYKMAYESQNEEIKRQSKKYFHDGEILFTGHTHYAESNPQKRFMNDGLIRDGAGSYILIQADKIELKSEDY